jgi:putative tricarboxylic transport membrane protein
MGSTSFCLNRRGFALAAVALALSSVMSGAALPAAADDYPAQDITFIVAAGVGGGTDILARTLAKVLHDKGLLSVNMLVENRTGGSGAVGYSYLNTRSDDPYFLGGVGVSFFTTPLLSKMPYNYESFTPVAAIARSPYILTVRADSEIRTVDDLKAAKGISIGTVGAVSDPALLASMINLQVGSQIKAIPYDGGGEVLAAVLGGHLDLLLGNPNEILEQIKAGTVRPIAVVSPERMASLPDVPTFKELGYDITHTQLRGIVMPGDVPPETVAFWEQALKTVAESPEWREQYVDRFNETPLFMNSAEFGAAMAETSTLYETMMRDLNLIK